MVKIKKIFLILGVIVILGALVFILYILKQGNPIVNQEKPIVNKVGLWKDCDPKINNCETGLECSLYGKSIYKCIKYLKEGEECGISVAETCSEGLSCVDTDKTRTRCGAFTIKGDAQECFVEPLQVCKRINKNPQAKCLGNCNCMEKCKQEGPTYFISVKEGSSECSVNSVNRICCCSGI